MNAYFFQINDVEELKMLTEYAKRLGAGLTENIEEATHIISNAGISYDLLKDLVKTFLEFCGRSSKKTSPNMELRARMGKKWC